MLRRRIIILYFSDFGSDQSKLSLKEHALCPEPPNFCEDSVYVVVCG